MFLTLVHHRGKFGGGSDIVFKCFYANDMRKVGIGRCTKVDIVKHIIEAFVFAVEEVIDLHHDRTAIRRHCLHLECCDERIDVVACH